MCTLKEKEQILPFPLGCSFERCGPFDYWRCIEFTNSKAKLGGLLYVLAAP